MILPHIPARKTPWGEVAIWLLARGALRRMFARVRVAGGDALHEAAVVPLLAVANHPSWWDGYIALALARHWGRARYLMMDEPQLRRYPFFAWAGCFSVDRHDARETARSLAYAADILATERAPLLWLFPQGELLPSEVRPVVVQSGPAHILRRATNRRAHVGILPVAWDLAFRGEQHPEIFVRVRDPVILDHTAARDIATTSTRIASELTAALDTLTDDLRERRLDAYRTILRGRAGINDVLDRWLGRPRLMAEP